MLFQAGREESQMGAYGFKSSREENFERNSLITKFAYDFTPNLSLQLKLSVQKEDRKRTDFKKGYTRLSKDTKYRIAPILSYKFKNDSKLIISGYWYDWDFRTKEYEGSSGYTPRNGDMYYTDVEVRYSLPLSNHLLTTGAEYLQEKLDYNLSKKTLHLSSVYLQDEFKFTFIIPIDFVIGGRIDHHSKYGTEFCPKLSLMLSLTENTRIRASVGRGFKSPTIRQAYYDQPFQHGSYWFKSNPHLEAETSWGYSVGIEQTFGSYLLLSATAFRNDINNMIVTIETNETIAGLPVKTYENIQEAYTQGVEVAGKLILIKDLLWINTAYTYLDTENKDTKKELPYIPHHNLAGHIVFNYKNWGLTFDAGIQYVSKMYKNTKNTKEIKDYSVVDVKLIKRISKNASFSIEGNNIFDSDYGEPDKEWGGSNMACTYKNGLLKIVFL